MNTDEKRQTLFDTFAEKASVIEASLDDQYWAAKCLIAGVLSLLPPEKAVEMLEELSEDLPNVVMDMHAKGMGGMH